jgi:hypothetical protein
MESTLEEERSEVWTSILESLRLPPDQDREAACRHLLRHLMASGGHGITRTPEPYRLTVTDSSKISCGS